ncbi:DUF4054 domain-containing protein [Phenylobacterium sp.]|uniref:DUF4054 domain-containing protein n=1 Tax=Phenylobacterium sp. TaxID=1871053 RepID=UPI00271F9BDE|nr:DUF4054 domain-containing protein [Phenylobacterium sp.]MDO8800052.1 DUF4054 domain-containing protein [Phenylobacterium sp.]
MAYTTPTAADLKAKFPTFAAVADGVVTSAITDANRQVDESWLEGDYANAIMLLAAHNLALDGHGASREIQLLGFKRVKVGPLELERAASSSDAAAGSLGSTSFGVRYAELRRLNFSGGIVA